MTAPLPTLDDSTLIKRVLAGQVECFAALMDRHVIAIKKRIHRMLPHAQDADDLVQEVFLKVWCRLSTFRFESTFRTWITSVATNEVLQFIRRQRQRPRRQEIGSLDILPSRGESPHQSFARVEATQEVHRAVVGLPPKYRQVLILRDLKELGERETAQWLDISIPAMKTRLFRARRKLSEALRQSRIRETFSRAA